MSGISGTLSRIHAMVLRHVYLMRSSWPRLIELIYWPLVQMLMWGFLQSWLAETTSGAAFAGGTLIGAVLLWDILMRGQLGFAVSFLEEMWSRNIANILMSPLRPFEFVLSMATISLIRLMIGLVPVALLADLFFGFKFWSLGPALALFFSSLMLTAWAVGLFSAGIILRHGLGAEGVVWSLMFLILPVTCVYYPLSSLPEPLQWIAVALPPTHVFEGMRALLLDGTFRGDLMLKAFALNVLYLTSAAAIFAHFLASARERGTLVQLGE